MKNILSVLITGCFLFTLIAATQSCTKDEVVGGKASSNLRVDSITPGSGAANAVLVVYGSGLGQIQSIVFDSGQVAAAFNPVFNTDNALIFRVPTEAIPAQQNVVLTNSLGTKVSIPFLVLGLPTITDVSNYNYGTANPQITLTGKNLADVTHVALAGSEDTAIIVSQTLTSLTLAMPVGSSSKDAKLNITNTAGTVTTTQSFVNLDNAGFKFFTDDYGPDISNASWGPAAISTTVSKTGTSSFAATYQKGNWSADGFASWNTGVASSPDYKYLSFWVKGGSQDYTLYITGDMREGGYGNSDQSAPILIPANVWTYFKIDLATLELWKKGTPFKQLGFWIKGPDAQDETFYFDDVIFVNK